MAESQNDPYEAFRRLWGPLGVPVPGLTMPTLDPAEIDKRLAELRSVEGWLNMNLNMLRMAIQGLELQKATLQSLRMATGSGGETGAASPPPLPMMWPWEVLQQALNAAAASRTPTDPQRREDPQS